MSQTEIFRKRVGHHMQPAEVVVAPDAKCGEVVARLSETGVTAALVVGSDGGLTGLVTERDMLRRMTFQANSDTPVGDVMTTSVLTVKETDFLYHAIARMRRLGMRHLPVADDAGAPVGLVTLDSGFVEAFDERLDQLDRLTQEGTVDGLREVKAAEVDLAQGLFDDHLQVPEIQSVLTHLNHDIHGRAVEMTVAGMAADGHGPPPVAFCFIIMGSGGRDENYIYPDQDNGIILADYPDADHSRIDAWFIEFSERLCRDLDAIGFPLCKGFVMATNPVWRKSISQWRDQIAGWCRRRSTVALRLSDIFFDFQPVHGAFGLARELRSYVTELMPANPMFLQELQRDDEAQGVGLRWFNRFITEKDDSEHLGALNLKSTGTLPLVQAARLLALREGIEVTSTRERLEALHGKGLIGADTHDYLRGAFRLITMLLLRQQMRDYNAGETVSNYVHPDTLSRRERDMLVEGFKAIRRFRDRVRGDFTGDVF